MMKRHFLLSLLLWMSLLGGGSLQAEVLVLIPGSEGQQGQPFREAGIPQTLIASGWVDGGRMLPTPQGVEFERGAEAPERVFYTLIMPTDRPVPTQAEWLNQYLDGVARRHGETPILLVGHSIAGVVARYALVTRPRPQVRALVTIATPNVDPVSLELASVFWRSPLGTATPLLGSVELQMLLEWFSGLSQHQSGNILSWLVHQPHPDIRYVSIVRLQDPYVEPRFQDLNAVMDLQGRSEVIGSGAGHYLTSEDGAIIAALFSRTRRQ